MKANVGDAITMTTEHVGQANRHGTIREVHGPDGGPPYLVEWSDGHTGLINPGPGSVLRVHGQEADRPTAAT
ncbi:hypothetical protein N864_12730 [Intrasporangium chromatireducens Q5-1]|uniref:DUF1918 domain-containing protein n=1 Tax=Intrasporangium chromatireducens Q5-1 TaxID=584657 RepID=W9GGK9_9MICO|nr:DUF1918 domain-containing protein [Intrasporangium chromatireducens]EWT03963.1 hypothetical protein N864_12730 [Intrasporangium chromatireducens Q5-1]